MQNKPPIIGITTYARSENREFRIDTDYVDAVRRAGGVPLLVPPGETHLDQVIALLDGLILSGGGDVNPETYGAEAHAQVAKIDHERDDFELAMAKFMLEIDKPMLCVCRGMQVLNIAMGGSLIQHIPDEFDGSLEHRIVDDALTYGSGPTPHDVTLSADSRLAKMMKNQTVTTVSWHHQSLDKVAPGLEVVAKAADGVIEAVELSGKPVFAVQWHPELSAAEDPAQQNLFDAFINLSKKG